MLTSLKWSSRSFADKLHIENFGYSKFKFKAVVPFNRKCKARRFTEDGQSS